MTMQLIVVARALSKRLATILRDRVSPLLARNQIL